MANEMSRPSVLLMEADAQSIEAVATALLQETREPLFSHIEDGARGQLEEEVAFFFNELVTIVLNSISTAQLEDIELFSLALERAVAKTTGDVHQDMPLNERLVARLDTMAYVLRAVLRTHNLAKYLGQLSGVRRAAWGELLVKFYEASGPLTKSDARKLGTSLTDPNTVYNALERLTKMGLLEKTKQEQRVLYSVSWPGRMVARAWRDLHADVEVSEGRLREYIDALLGRNEPLPSAETSWGACQGGQIERTLVVTGLK